MPGTRPTLYQAALRHDALHALEHATFLAFGIAVWMALLGPLPKPAWFNNAARLVYIIAVRLDRDRAGQHPDLRGHRLLPLLPGRDAHWHISPIADQVAAGGLMMVEESLLTIGLFCWLFLRVARENEERQELLDYAIAARDRARRGRAQRAVAPGAATSCGSGCVRAPRCRTRAPARPARASPA